MPSDDANFAASLGLSRLQIVAILTFTVLLFLFVEGPIWTHAWNPDGSILWSYAPIPILVAACQVGNRSLRPLRWFVASFVLAAVKYLLTAFVLIALLTVNDPPPRRRPAASVPQRVSLDALGGRPAAPPFPPSSPRGILHGKIVNSAGQAVAGAAVFVSDRFDEWTFENEAPVETLTMGAGNISPDVACLRRGGVLHVKVRDGLVHTLQGWTRAGQYLFNEPIVHERDVKLSTSPDRVRLRCAVHRDESADLAILTHPFFTRTSDTGGFAISGVPAGRRGFAVWRAGSEPFLGNADVYPDLTEPVVVVLGGRSAEIHRK